MRLVFGWSGSSAWISTTEEAARGKGLGFRAALTPSSVRSNYCQHGVLPKGWSSPCPFAGMNIYTVSCIGLKIILEMLRFHLDMLPDPASSATWESCACATQARGLVATELHPKCHHGGESGCPWEGQTGAQHIAGLSASASPPPGPAHSPGTEPWLSSTR